ncbi:hypothetical protein [Enorma burkinafasonensis]|uniref:hypothetical protein n=1 Tax=Enorma burkinafasonensis TaxID=2590867 RepID=UPI00119D7B39|nr:hypothetical protein [Enorma burkinafasonensis]
MDNTVATAFYPDDDSPLIQYEIAFQKKPKLLVAGAGAFGGSSYASKIFAGPTETLEDDIKWEPHIDEADKLDCIVAVSSGVLAGLIDVFYVGEFSLDRASEWGKDKIEKVVMKVARVEGYTGDDLNDAIKTLEKNHPLAADGNTNDFGGGLQHHLRDFSHHFSIGGLFFSIFTQFTGLVVGTDKAGALHVVPVPESHRACIGKNFQEKIAFGAIGWFFHMVSDMAGSSGSLMGGTGIPGPLVSFMKELSALPFFKDAGDGDMGFRLWVTKLFNGTLLADHDESGRIIKDSVKKFDLRTEIGILGEIGRQTIPVLINQCVVRGFYFCRRLAREIRDLKITGIAELERIAPEDVLPWGTPAMRRMVTVSSGVFTGVDIADAAVRAIKSKDPITFFLRVNYVGVATFVIACVVDVRAALDDKKLDEGESPEEAYERGISELGCLKLDFMQARILHSIEYALVAYDIAAEKHPKRAEKKRAWLKEWGERVVEAVGLVWVADAGYFLGDDAIYDSIMARLENSANDSWLWLVAMEAKRFRPYVPLHGDNDKLYKGLKLGSGYLEEVYCDRQSVVSEKELAKLDKAVNGARGRLDGAVTKRVVGAAGTVIVVVATGGLAFYFAPAIAPTLATALGLEAAALHGAALTSASLAFLGGGAIAAGGAGMAGGTMLIAGGGALIGAVGGSGVSAATSMALATNGSYVLDECAKLVAFCEEVLIGRFGDRASVAEIHAALNQRIVELEVEIEAIKRGVPDDEVPEDDDDGTDEKEEISPKKMIKILNRSLKFMRRSSDELTKSLKAASKKKMALPEAGRR